MKQQKKAEKGNTVKVHYKGELKDGTVFDSSFERNEPLKFTIGEQELISGFENAIIGMNVGESKIIHIKPEEAYGEHSPALVHKVEKKYFPPHIDPKVGMQLQIGENEEKTFVRISNIDEDHIELDANHPLAGKELIFSIELVEVI